MAPTPILMERELGLGGRGAQLVHISIVMSTVALFLVINRLYFRITLGKTFGADDYAIAASMVSLSLSCCASFLLFFLQNYCRQTNVMRISYLRTITDRGLVFYI